MPSAAKAAFAASFSMAVSCAAVSATPGWANDSVTGQPPSPQTHWLRDEQSGCRAPDPDFAEGDGIVWSGACANGVVSGAGTLTFLNKGQPQVTISGLFRDGDLESGRASFAWPDGSKYDGEQVHGKFNGQGVFLSAQQDRLEGEWKDGKLNGHAAVTWANGNRYDGGWLDGKAQGHGIETWANGDRYDGDWVAGKAQGHGVQVWANGQSYDGEWSDDQPNGAGKLVRADRTTFAGRFVNGHPQGASAGAASAASVAAQAAPPAAAQVTATAAPTAAPIATSLPAAPMAVSEQAIAPKDRLGEVDGKKLLSVDGSSIALTSSEGGFTRAITKSDGSSSTTSFTFLNDRMGTVADAGNPTRVTGMFKMTDTEIDVDYSDGHSEVLRPGAGGVTLSMRSADGQSACMAWYPEGHAFSEAERKAALAAYASKLGVPLKGADSRALQHSSACDAPSMAIAPTIAPAPAAKLPPARLRNIPHPMPRPIQASFEPAAPHQSVAQASQPKSITVRTSEVHLIDTPTPEITTFPGGQSGPSTSAAVPAPGIAAAPSTAALPAAVAPVASPAGAPAPAVVAAVQSAYQPGATDPGASACLAVASDGSHWGFRNSCNYTVQYVYCLKGDSEPLASCKDGNVAGSAAPNSFSALVADASMAEKNIDHQFRWVACGGGAGEVVPKLDAIDPPLGRCLRARTAAK